MRPARVRSVPGIGAGRLGAEEAKRVFLAGGKDWVQDLVTPLRKVRAPLLGGAGRVFLEYSTLLAKNPTPLHPLPPSPKADDRDRPKSPGGGGVRSECKNLLKTRNVGWRVLSIPGRGGPEGEGQ